MLKLIFPERYNCYNNLAFNFWSYWENNPSFQFQTCKIFSKFEIQPRFSCHHFRSLQTCVCFKMFWPLGKPKSIKEKKKNLKVFQWTLQLAPQRAGLFWTQTNFVCSCNGVALFTFYAMALYWQTQRCAGPFCWHIVNLT